ncbi:MAG: hypothetical protein LBK54_12765 [Propionibacteriaceae bacterium]|jgi:hypothetical protein|nr:hypothetical protein [Propionibacteriaceae bacterium]
MVRKLWIAVVLAVSSSFGLVGCGEAEVGPATPEARIANSLAEYFQRTLELQNPSPLEREVIERAIVAGQLDPADYEAAHSRYAQCMAEHGFDLSFRKTPDGLYIELPNIDNTGHRDTTAASLECDRDNGLIMALYRTQQANPGLLADNRLTAIQCLQRSGFVDADYTVDDFERDQSTDTFPFDQYETGPNNCLCQAGYAYFSVEG